MKRLVAGAQYTLEKKTPTRIIDFDFEREALRITAQVSSFRAVTLAQPEVAPSATRALLFSCCSSPRYMVSPARLFAPGAGFSVGRRSGAGSEMSCLLAPR